MWSQRPLPLALGRRCVGWQTPVWALGMGLGDGLPVSTVVLSQGFPEVGEEELVSVPDAKFTKGEFEVSVPPRFSGGHLGEERG